jgi:hypothetical protein
MPERTTPPSAARYPGVFAQKPGQAGCFDCDTLCPVFYPKGNCTLTYFALAGYCKTCVDERAPAPA